MITLQTIDHTFDIHTSVNEVLVNQFTDFYKAESRYLHSEQDVSILIEALRFLVPNIEHVDIDLDDTILVGVDDFTLVNPKHSEHITIHRVYAHYLNLFNHFFCDPILQLGSDIEKLSDQGKAIVLQVIQSKGIEELRKNAMLFWEHVNASIEVIEGKFTFEHKGHVYRLANQDVKDYFFGRKFKVGEYVKIQSFRDRIETEIKSKGDATGALDMVQDLYTIAMLCKRDEDVLPIQSKSLDVWLDRRVSELEDLPMDIVYCVSFFLHNIVKNYILQESLRTLVKE